jgi:hypothetical protein
MFKKITIALGLVAAVGCGELVPPPSSSSTLRLAIRADNDLRRAPVFMDHGKHTEALGADSCAECHKSRDNELVLAYARLEPIADPDELMSLYHAECTGCHKDRAARGEKTGPVTCGECHVEGPEPVATQVKLRWDYSMHGRHAAAEKDRCESCHHVYDEQAKKLVYVKGQESACRDCHGGVTDGNELSWRAAAHKDCVNCHRGREGDTGPVMCTGCHDAEAIAKHKKMPEPPLILRGQPNRVWLLAEGARSLPVHFNHLTHESQATICSDCHHQTLEKCSSCHTVTGSDKGHWVTLEMAYHDASSLHSCVGCHEKNSRKVPSACAGCHVSLARGPAERTCAVCHREQTDEITPVELAMLPEYSDAYPARVKIDFLVDDYGPSTLPHGAIVAKLDAAVRESNLATTFHASTETLCSGCHHHSPAGERPPPCRSCHRREADALDDKPGLKAAYHRQCIGCHEQMELKVGCEDCHKEVSP